MVGEVSQTLRLKRNSMSGQQQYEGLANARSELLKREQLGGTVTSTPKIWELIASLQPSIDEDVRFWWTVLGIPLAVLFQKAGYSIEFQYKHLLFFYFLVAPELGGCSDSQGLSTSWKSFMTDHFTPIEMSWEWGSNSNGGPTIRYAFEPIGAHAGTCLDPLNEGASARVMHRYSQMIPGCDTTLFNHFAQDLLCYDPSPNSSQGNINSQGHASRCFLAIEFDESEVMVKAYFFPIFKAVRMNQCPWTLMSDSILNMPGYSPLMLRSLSIFETFLRCSPEGLKLVPEILAIDCGPPADSRMKIYMRSRSTTFESVRRIMTLDGALHDIGLDKGLDELYILWTLIFWQGQNVALEASLRSVDHRTAGILYYFNLKQGGQLPSVKIYLPVRHYGRNDCDVAQNVLTYLRLRGRTCSITGYLEALTAIAHPKPLASQHGLQTYLGCSIIGETLRLTSYIAPQAYEN